jgi:hypothetical protein
LVKFLRIKCKTDEALPVPILDNNTRWNSIYYMLQTVLNNKGYYESIDDNIIDNTDWTFLEEFVNIFKPVEEFTKKLQKEQYVIGDFYRDWKECELTIEEIEENNLTLSLLSNIKKRKEKLMENNAFLAALYFDPRFNFENSPLLSQEQKDKSKVFIN